MLDLLWISKQLMPINSLLLPGIMDVSENMQQSAVELLSLIDLAPADWNSIYSPF